MTDKEIIDGLIARDNDVTYRFFFVTARPLLRAVMRAVFDSPVSYDELVNELYNYLMEQDAARLRQFQFRSSLYQWIKIVATRLFINRRNLLNAHREQEQSLDQRDDSGLTDPDTADRLSIRSANHGLSDQTTKITEKIDLATLLNLIPNPRYAETIRKLVIEDREPEQYAAAIGVSVANLYNIKKRAMAALSKVALKYYCYGG